MSKNVPEWINTLALDIYKIIQRYKAMSRFEDMVKTWAEGHEAEIDNLKTWNHKRRLHFEKTIATDVRLKNEKAGPPEQGWQFESYVQHIEQQTESGLQRSYIQGWVPPELSISAEPEITRILPLGRDHELTLAEKYTVFATVYDYGRKGTEGMPPWPWPGPDDWDKPGALSNAKRGIFFEGLCRAVSELEPDDEGWLRAILGVVEENVAEWAGVQRADLKKQTAKAASETRSERYIRWVKNHPVLSVLYVVFKGTLALGAVAGSIYAVVILVNYFGGQDEKGQIPKGRIEDQPIVSVRATVEIAIRSEEQVNARHPYNGAVLAFGKGTEALVTLSSRESQAKQMGTGEVRYSSELDMKVTDKAFKQPLSLLQQVEYAQVRFEIIPPNSDVLSGTVICIFNNNIPIQVSVSPQKMRENLITIPNINLAEVLEQPANRK